jgi:putative transcriptional regulator
MRRLPDSVDWTCSCLGPGVGARDITAVRRRRAVGHETGIMAGMTTRARIFALAALALVASAAQAQAPAAGRLLVATPELEDPNFTESVLLIVHHDEDGTLGVFINRPTWVDPGKAFPESEPLQHYPDSLYLGGPIAPTQLLILARSTADLSVESTPVLGDVRLAADLALIDDEQFAGAGDETLRIYAGHAAWEPGQLDAEIGSGSWHVVTGRSDLVFSRRPLELWSELQTAPENELSARLGFE